MYLKYATGILEVYFECTSSVLQVNPKFTSSILQPIELHEAYAISTKEVNLKLY